MDFNVIFLYVVLFDVVVVGECFGVILFDIDGVIWSYCGEFCIFDVMIDEFGFVILVLFWFVMLVCGVDMV